MAMKKMRTEGQSDFSMNRRDMLKVMGAGALLAMLPGYGLGGSASAFSPSKGQGLIFLVGDGMPLGVIKGMHEIRTRIYGDKDSIFYSRMKDVRSALGHASTHSLSSVVTDSAPGSVAWSTGSKTSNKLLASLPDGRPLRTIMELLKDRGYACGLVTTARVTHATPAAWVSHQMDRDKEDQIALDYLKFKPDVLLGGGSKHFAPSARKDGKDLFKAFSDAGYDVIKERASLLAYEGLTSQKPLLGTFASSHLDYYLDRTNQFELGNKEPALPEMTRIALQKLSRHPKGFILQVEAGRIDHANHNNDAWAAIQDTYELDLTLSVVEEFLRENPKTLVIVASDHGTGCFGINGTGPEYNDSTEALKKYQPIKASLEYIKKKMKKEASPAEIKDVFEHFTTYRISDEEAALISKSRQQEFRLQHGDYVVQPESTMGRILAHSIYEKVWQIFWDGKAILRRGNVGFTSSHHTAEDQIVLAYGHRARELGLGRQVDNTYLFTAMCKFFGIQYKNPTMTEEEAKPLIKTASMRDWERHMEMHIA
ncbi:MAG: alkaline phosphatase [Deltaproteobacteria bacterium HGW-Deltaproteobacteria-15]|jgi:alkaline phosphatase|nr:MAG: alkaline phosphatase [Deltaproteobacteria bacterium HGW-Deltaproteobacteria-15]